MHYFKTSKRVGFNVSNVLFGEMPFIGCNKFVNFIIRYTKHYIFNCSKQNKKPVTVLFKYRIKGIYQSIMRDAEI